MNPQIDKTKLTIDQQAMLENYQQEQDQLQKLEDIASMTQELVTTLGDMKGSTKLDNIGTLLVDMRESLASLNAKEAPDTPDFAKPVVDAVSKLEKALSSALRVTVSAPAVNVAAPNVTVDAPAPSMKGVEAALKAIPGAFKEAIALIPPTTIPETNFQPLLDTWDGISQQLLSIETATRMKPQFPTTLKVTNADGTEISDPSIFRDYDAVAMADADANGNYQTLTYTKNSLTKFTLNFTFDASSNVTSIARS